MTKQTARELLDVIVSDINSLDLSDYHVIFQLGNIANSLIRVIDVAGNEIFTKEDN